MAFGFTKSLQLALATLLVSSLGSSFCKAALGSAIVFSTDFEAGLPSEFSGAGGVESVQGYAGIGNTGNTFSGDFLVNRSQRNPASSTQLTLSGLPAHDSVNIGFLLGIINSWDGSNENDRFNVMVDGNLIFSETFDHFNTIDQSYVAPTNGQLTSRVFVNGQDRFPDLGFGGAPEWGDAAYDMTLEPSLLHIPHTSSDLTVTWFGQFYSGQPHPEDEFWGIDNLEISLNGTESPSVPEPSMILGTAMGLGFGVVLRKKRSA
ncbi:MAG: PEP-CTERM sorting domain-containing protein [Xenococcaceae cyanobacterium]